MPRESKQITVKCNTCKKDFTVFKSNFDLNKNKLFYCNKGCFKNRDSGRISITCQECGKIFKRQPYLLKRITTAFCSSDCHNNYLKKSKITLKCATCGKEFKSSPFRGKDFEKQFCTQECYFSWMKDNPSPLKMDRVIVPCIQCGKELEFLPTDRWNYHFCSKECNKQYRSINWRGAKNPNWHGGIDDSLYPSEFNKILRENIRDRDGRKCQWCGKTELENGRKLDVHHINYQKDDYTPDNLLCLCNVDHPKTNTNRQVWINMFTFLMILKEKQTHILTYDNL